MATRNIVTYGNSYTDGTSSDAYVTSARQSRFTTLFILDQNNKKHNLGGLQTLSMTQSNGGHWEPQAGDDYLEIILVCAHGRASLRGAWGAAWTWKK